MASPQKYKPNISSGEVHEPQAPYSRNAGFVFESEDDRLLRDASLPPLEKLKSFTRMIRRSRMLKRNNI
jgi:hypothetical protein